MCLSYSQLHYRRSISVWLPCPKTDNSANPIGVSGRQGTNRHETSHYNCHPMFRLTREVRFAANGESDPQLQGAPTNSYAGFPSLVGFAPWLALQVTVAGKLEAQSNYLINIKQID